MIHAQDGFDRADVEFHESHATVDAANRFGHAGVVAYSSSLIHSGLAGRLQTTLR